MLSIDTFALFLGLEPQLAASRGNVVAFLTPQRHGNTAVVEDAGKALLARDAGALPRQALHRVVGDEIHVRMQVAGDVRKSRQVHIYRKCTHFRQQTQSKYGEKPFFLFHNLVGEGSSQEIIQAFSTVLFYPK